MKKKIHFILLFLTVFLIGCNNEENNSTYTQSELETFLIRDSKEAVYAFTDENLIYNFNFTKTSEGNVGEYHRQQLSGNENEDCKFIWEIEPSGDGGIVTIAFEGNKGRIRVRMGLIEQSNLIITITPNGQQERYESEMLWKLYFTPQDDPLKKS